MTTPEPSDVELPAHRFMVWCPEDRSQGIQLSVGPDMERDEAVRILLAVAGQVMAQTTLHPQGLETAPPPTE